MNALTPPISHNNRSAWIEWTRVVSCMGVVWHHADGPYKFLAPAALIAFVIMGCAFIRKIETPAQFATALRLRTERLIIPWLLWSLIYGGLRCFEAYRHGEPLLNWWEPRMWLYGTWVHLWFLPMLFVVTIIVMLFDIGGAKIRRNLTEPFGWLLVVGSPLWIQLELMELGKPFHQWSAVIPAVGLGILMREHRPGDAAARRRIALVLTVHMAALGVAALTMSDQLSFLLKHALGALALFAWAPAVKGSRVGLALGALTMGVYLVHPLILNLMSRLPDLRFNAAAYAVIAIVLSYIAAFMMATGWRLAENALRRFRSATIAPVTLPQDQPSS